ncbi:hypothetical protein [Jeotgalicoccus sp. WY2]|uniref:hypothetical protein n=1 Tax=Jeotgalicoccus sp. WY2 TaxID=2708346 RepID=UPI001BD3221A|nr:hypothetical protein [Jeotgalicoccus sp. WY2]
MSNDDNNIDDIKEKLKRNVRILSMSAILLNHPVVKMKLKKSRKPKSFQKKKNQKMRIYH